MLAFVLEDLANEALRIKEMEKSYMHVDLGPRTMKRRNRD